MQYGNESSQLPQDTLAFGQDGERRIRLIVGSAVLVVAIWCRAAVRRGLAGVAAEAPVLGCHVVCVDSRRYVEYHIWVPLVLDRRELWVVNSPELAMLELNQSKCICTSCFQFGFLYQACVKSV
jgi:hypothetical protein